MSAAAETASAVRGIVDSPLTADLERWSRDALRDLTAALVGGAPTGLAQAAARYARGGDPSRRAFHLATAANALDAEDGHDLAGGVHVGSALVGALLATAAPDASLSRLRAALVSGYEVGLRAGHLFAPQLSGEPYRASGTAAAIGAAAALAALEGLDPAAAVRIAHAHAPASPLVSSRARESIGWAAQTAVAAVELVAAGFADERLEAVGQVPTGEHLFDTFARHPQTSGLGQRFLAPEVYVKPYTACRAAHAAIEAALALRVDGRVPVHVTVAVRSDCAGLDAARPATLSAAQFSIPWSVALAFARGPEAVAAMGEDALSRHDPHALAERISVRADPRFDSAASFPAAVTAAWQDGSVTSRTVSEPLGGPSRPLSADALSAKAMGLLRAGGISGVDAERIGSLWAGDEGTAGELRAALRLDAGTAAPRGEEPGAVEWA